MHGFQILLRVSDAFFLFRYGRDARVRHRCLDQAELVGGIPSIQVSVGQNFFRKPLQHALARILARAGLPSFQGLVLPRSTFLVGSVMQILKLSRLRTVPTWRYSSKDRVTEFTVQAWLGAKTTITKMMSR
jgi:hypothetical protein